MFTWKALVGLLPDRFYALLPLLSEQFLRLTTLDRLLYGTKCNKLSSEAYYVFGWSMSYCLNHMGFKEDFIEERKKRKRKIKGWY